MCIVFSIPAHLSIIFVIRIIVGCVVWLLFLPMLLLLCFFSPYPFIYRTNGCVLPNCIFSWHSFFFFIVRRCRCRCVCFFGSLSYLFIWILCCHSVLSLLLYYTFIHIFIYICSCRLYCANIFFLSRCSILFDDVFFALLWSLLPLLLKVCVFNFLVAVFVFFLFHTQSHLLANTVFRSR